MTKELIKNLQIVKSDLRTIEKFQSNPEHIHKIKMAKSIAIDLKADESQDIYIAYKLYVTSLKGVGFYELTALDRFQDPVYISELNHLINSAKKIADKQMAEEKRISLAK